MSRLQNQIAKVEWNLIHAETAMAELEDRHDFLMAKQKRYNTRRERKSYRKRLRSMSSRELKMYLAQKHLMISMEKAMYLPTAPGAIIKSFLEQVDGCND